MPFHVRCHTLNLDTCVSKPQWMLLSVSMTENYCQMTFWFNHFPVKSPRKKHKWQTGFPPDVKWHRAGPRGLHRNLSIFCLDFCAVSRQKQHPYHMRNIELYPKDLYSPVGSQLLCISIQIVSTRLSYSIQYSLRKIRFMASRYV